MTSNAFASADSKWPARFGARPYLTLGVAAVAVHILTTALRVRGAYFFSDDFLNFITAHNHGPLLQFLLQPVSGQVVPLHRLTNLIFFHFAGLNYPASVAVLMTLSSGSMAVLAMIAARARTPLWIAVGCVLTAALAWVTLDPVRWWSSGVHVMFGTFFSLCAIYVAAHPARTLGWTRAFLIAVIGAVGVCFYAKTLFALVLCGAIRLYIRRSQSSTDFWQDLYGAALDLSPALAVVAAYLVLYTLANRGGPVLGGPSSILASAVVALQFGWLTALTGIRVSQTSSIAVLALAALGADAIAAGVVFASLRRNPKTVWLWIGLIVCTVAGVILISTVRVQVFGLWLAASPRYNTDIVLEALAVILIAFGAAFAAPAGAGDMSQPTRPVGIAIAALVCSAQILGGLHYPRLDPHSDPAVIRNFFERLQRESVELSRTGGNVGERILPNKVTSNWIGPYRSLSLFAGILPRPFAVTGWDKAAYEVDDQGRLHSFDSLPRLSLTDTDGRTLTAALVAPFESAGQVERLSSGAVRGWANNLLAPPERTEIVIVDGAQIVARATRVLRPDVAPRFSQVQLRDSGFVARLVKPVPPDRLAAFILIDRRIAIALPILTEPQQQFVATHTIDPESDNEHIGASVLFDVGPSLTMAPPVVQGDWTQDGWFEGVGAAPLAGTGYGSHRAKGDAGVGRIDWSGVAPNGALAIAIPIVTGPVATKVSFKVVDARTGGAIAVLAHPAPITSWTIWQVKLPAGVTTVRLIAEDAGAGWGEWAGVGTPYAILPGR